MALLCMKAGPLFYLKKVRKTSENSFASPGYPLQWVVKTCNRTLENAIFRYILGDLFRYQIRGQSMKHTMFLLTPCPKDKKH